METAIKEFTLDFQTALSIAKELGTYDPEKVLLRWIERDYTGGGIKPYNNHEKAVQARLILQQIETLKPEHSRHPEDARLPQGAYVDKVLIATGVAKQDIGYSNLDPYFTAGGSISGVVEKGEDVAVYLGTYYGGFFIELISTASILRDHYNNNFFGNPLGGGTKTYEKGARRNQVSLRKKFNGDYHGAVHDIKVQKLDFTRVDSYIHSA